MAFHGESDGKGMIRTIEGSRDTNMSPLGSWGGGMASLAGPKGEKKNGEQGKLGHAEELGRR